MGPKLKSNTLFACEYVKWEFATTKKKYPFTQISGPTKALKLIERPSNVLVRIQSPFPLEFFTARSHEIKNCCSNKVRAEKNVFVLFYKWFECLIGSA